MRPTVGSTWSSMTCAACHQGSSPAFTGPWAKLSAGRAGEDARSATCSASTSRTGNGVCACSRPRAPDLVRSVNDIAQFPLARVMAVLSSVPDETSPDGRA